MGMNGNRQICQRIISGFLATGGVLSAAILAVQGQYAGWPQVISRLLAVGGCYLFGYFALRGYLPGTRLPKASDAIRRATSRHDV